MAIKIQFDASCNPISPTIVLGYKSGRLIGKLPVASVHMKDAMNASSDIQFVIYKEDCIKTIWDNIKDFKLVWCKEWNKWFEITVDLDDGEGIKKTVSCTSLGEAELSQINVPNLSINSEDDLKLNDYTPTVFYNPSDAKHSLLNRIMERAPHYSIGYVSNSLRNIQKNYSFDGSIHDAMMEIAEQTVALFRFDCYTDANGALKREVNVYDLESYCVDCGNRGEFTDACDKCGSTNIIPPDYGEDTTIFISTDNLANNVTFSTDTGSVKNCFRLEAGDDLMTATIRNSNPDGSNYIWYFNDDIKEDMSDELRTKLAEYQETYDYYQNDYALSLPFSTEINTVEGVIDSYSSHSADGVQYVSRVVIDGTSYDVTEKGILSADIAEYIEENIYAFISDNTIMSAMFWKTEDVSTYNERINLAIRKTWQKAMFMINWIKETVANGGLQRQFFNYLVNGTEYSDLRFLIGSQLLDFDMDAYFNSTGLAKAAMTLLRRAALSAYGIYGFDGYKDMMDRGLITNKEIELFPDELSGYSDLIRAYYNVIDFYIYLHDEMLPIQTEETKTANSELQKIIQGLRSVSVERLSGCSESTATNSVLSMIKSMTDTARYKIDITNVEYSTGGSSWRGEIQLSSYTDDEDAAKTDSPVTIEINEDYETFIKQRLDKILGKSETSMSGISALFSLRDTISDPAFTWELHKYNLTSLNAIRDICQSCVDILINEGAGDKDAWDNRYESGYLASDIIDEEENSYYGFWSQRNGESDNYTYSGLIEPRIGKIYHNLNDGKYYKYENGNYIITDDAFIGNIYKNVYTGYESKLRAIEKEIGYRENELEMIQSMQSFIESKMSSIQSNLNLQTFLGDTLWNELSAYRREDRYVNNNYISDGLSTRELIENAEKFIDAAKKEIFKSATLQHSITSTLKNLLFMKEFEPILQSFEVGNWLHIRADGTVYKLRLVGYEIDFDNSETVSVSFSDVKTTETGQIYDLENVISTSQSMATSFGYVARQADKGDKTNQKVENWVDNGLAATDVKIVNDNDNQNIVWDEHGILCREMNQETGSYSEEQTKIINKGLYITDDNWKTSRTAVGKFTFYNPRDKEWQTTYGVIADVLVGKHILGEDAGIYTPENAIVMDDKGLTITTSTDGKRVFAIQKDNGENVEDLMYVNDNGDLVLNGSIRINENGETDDYKENIKKQVDLMLYKKTKKNGEIVTEFSDEIQGLLDKAQTENELRLDGYYDKAYFDGFLSFDPDTGLSIGQSGSDFKTVITNTALEFKEDATTTAYISNEQLYINSAIINDVLSLGNYALMPHRGSGKRGFSILWKG